MTAVPTAPPRRRWLWVRRGALVLLLAAAALRLLLALCLAPLADFAAGFAGLSISWRSASLSLSRLHLHIQDLAVRIREEAGGPPLLAAQDLIVDLSTRGLLAGRLCIHDVALAGVRVELRRGADGSLRMPSAWQSAPAAPPAEPPVPDSHRPAGHIEFELPFQLDSLRIHDAILAVDDHTGPAPQRHTATIDVEVAHVGAPSRAGTVRVRVASCPWFDHLMVDGELETAADGAALRCRTELRGARLAALPFAVALPEPVLALGVVDLSSALALRAGQPAAGSSLPDIVAELDLAVGFDGERRGGLSARLGDSTVPAGTDRAGLLRFDLEFDFDGLVERLRIDRGHVVFDAAGTALFAALEVRGLTLRRLRRLLEGAGIQLPRDGTDIRGELAASFSDSIAMEFRDLKIGADGAQAFALPQAGVEGLRFTDGVLAIGAVRISGPEIALTRHADGALSIADVRIVPATPGESPAVAEAAARIPSVSPALPRLRVGMLEWQGSRLRYRDETCTPPGAIEVNDVQLRGDGLAVGIEAPPGRLRFAARLPGVVEQLAAELQLASSATTASAGLRLTGEGLSAAALAPWLEPHGIAPLLGDGRLGASANATVAIDGQRVRIDAGLADVELASGGETWLALGALEGRGVVLDPAGLELGAWTIDQPRIALRRDEDAAWCALGLRFAPAPESPAPAAASPPLTAPATTPTSTAAPAKRPRRGAIAVRGAQLTVPAPGEPDHLQAIAIDAQLGPDDGTATPIPFALDLRAADAVEALAVRGALALRADGLAVAAELQGSGLAGRGLSRLLPPGQTAMLADGRLSAQLAADIGGGGKALDVAVTDLRLHDGDELLFGVDRCSLRAPALSAAEFHVEYLQLTGLTGSIEQTEQGIVLAGMQFGGQAAAPAGPPAAERNGAAAPAPAPSPATPLPITAVRVDAVDLRVERLVLADRRAPTAEPLVLAASLELAAPWRTEALAVESVAMDWQLRASAAPLGAELTGALRIDPFALSPTADLELSIEGIDTTALRRAFPASAEVIEGLAADLLVEAICHLRLDLRRRDPRVFDFSRPFGGELVVEKFAVRDASAGETLASIRWIDVIARAIDPRTGAVLLRLVEISEPRLRALRTAAGLELLGLRLIAADAAATPPPGAGGELPDGAAPGTEFAIDHLEVSGLGFDFRDETTAPATHLPIDDLDFELHHASTRALTEPLPMSFALALRGGDVELPRRQPQGSLLSGVLSTAASLTGLNRDAAVQQRPLIDELRLQGQLQLRPYPRGRIQARIDSLELPSFRGLARNSGVDIADGLLDLNLDAELRGLDGTDVDLRAVFTSLSLSEPASGPISTYLRLPAPLDTVLFLLRNDADEQRIAARVHVPSGGLPANEIRDLAGETLAKIIAAAIGGAATRTASGLLTAMFGSSAGPDATGSVAFAAGDPLPTDLQLDAVVAAVKSDPLAKITLIHELGTGDLERSSALANPPPAVVAAAARELRSRRTELVAERNVLAADVLARYAAGQVHDARRLLGELQAVDTRLGELEATLGNVLDAVGGATERAAKRRARAAAQSLGQARLGAVQLELRRRLPALAADRFELRAVRSVVTEGLDGGRVIAVVRRRPAS